jgi:hypothetical protein
MCRPPNALSNRSNNVHAQRLLRRAASFMKCLMLVLFLLSGSLFGQQVPTIPYQSGILLEAVT